MAASNEAIVLELIGVDNTKKAHDSAKQGLKSHEAQVNRLIKKLKEEAATIGMTNRELEEYRIANLKASDAQKAEIRSLNATIEAKKRAIQSSKGLNQQLRFMRGGFGQVGHQIQDMAVQAQMGTDALIIFGQQGSQIASLFGPKGAMIGAVLAVGAAIGVGLSSDVETGGDALDDLKQRVDKLLESTGKLTPKMLEFNRAVKQQKIDTKTEELDKHRKSLEGVQEDLRVARIEMDLLSKNVGLNPKTSPEFERVRKKINELELAEVSLQTNMQVTQAEVDQLTGGIKRSAERRIEISNEIIDQANKELDELARIYEHEKKLEALRLQARENDLNHLHKKNDREMAALKEAHEERKRLFDERHAAMMREAEIRTETTDHSIELANRELQAVIEAEKKKQQEKQNTQKLDKQVLSSSEQLLGQLMSGMDKQSSAYKALFAVQQGIAIAQTIMNTEAAAANAVAPVAMGGLGPVAGLPYAGMIRALGYASAAIIAGQTVASFEGGGMTPNGPRAGGVDGRGGRMAVLHPNEKITDMRKSGDGQPVNINFNIQANDAAGFDELLVKRRGLIVNMVNKAVNNSGKRSIT